MLFTVLNVRDDNRIKMMPCMITEFPRILAVFSQIKDTFFTRVVLELSFFDRSDNFILQSRQASQNRIQPPDVSVSHSALEYTSQLILVKREECV